MTIPWGLLEPVLIWGSQVHFMNSGWSYEVAVMKNGSMLDCCRWWIHHFFRSVTYSSIMTIESSLILMPGFWLMSWENGFSPTMSGEGNKGSGNFLDGRKGMKHSLKKKSWRNKKHRCSSEEGEDDFLRGKSQPNGRTQSRPGKVGKLGWKTISEKKPWDSRKKILIS